MNVVTSPANAAARPTSGHAVGTDLYWLPEAADWRAETRALDAEPEPAKAWERLVALASTRLDLVRTNRIDVSLRRGFSAAPTSFLSTKPVRLAVLGSSTLAQLLPGIRVAGLRRGLHITTYEADYGQYQQALADPGSDLHAFKPTAILLAFDAHHLARGADPAMDLASANAAFEAVVAALTQAWRQAKRICPLVIQQTALPLFAPILGHNEHRLPGSKHRLVSRLNARLRDIADEEGVDLLSIDDQVAVHGLSNWHDPVLWHRAKQEIGPLAAPLYGDLVGRLLAARQGRSSKCLVLDLDNTLWGGVIGDDGLDGIVLGQGSAMGEAFVALQQYAKDLAKRGVILAVCSKNDEANALAAFERHPDMILKRADIASFVANWDDKARNIRRIAHELNIGLDSLVFLDDNPFERNLVRSELPMVAVPEVSDDPSLFARAIADAGYFEGVAITDEDRERSRQYQANSERAALQAEAADLPTYLASLGMELIWKRFDAIGLQRVTQLINKTNQFNLTTRRYTEAEVRGVIDDPNAFGLQLRLLDRFGDNGIIAIVIGRREGENVVIDTWLMSCRVLGRQVEEATLKLVVDAARRLGAKRLIGEYRPTAKNGMVKQHYAKLGFAPLEARDNGETLWSLPCDGFTPPEFFMSFKEG
jgi:FkbH-like protein